MKRVGLKNWSIAAPASTFAASSRGAGAVVECLRQGAGRRRHDDATDDRRVIRAGSVVTCFGVATILALSLPLQAHASHEAGSPSSRRTVFSTSFESRQPVPLKAVGNTDTQVAVVPGPGKKEVWTAKPNVGFHGIQALRYSGRESTTGQLTRRALFHVRIPVDRNTRLSYVILPVGVKGKQPQPSAHVIVDLAFADGSHLSRLQAHDQHHVPYTARGEGQARILYPDQWNAIDVNVGAAAQGKTITGTELVTQAPKGDTPFHGYIDDIRVGPTPKVSHPDPASYVDTRRGSNSNGRFSRGNNFPATAMPHGFNFWTPTTAAGSSWIYQYQQSNGPDNHPRLQAFALSHEPSPWMGDRQTFQVMPAQDGSGPPQWSRKARALGFTHAHEIARPYLYKVRFDNGMSGAMTPTDHAAMMQFTFTHGHGQLIFDNKDNRGGITLHPAKRSISGYSDVASGLSTGATRLFFYATFDQSVVGSGHLTGHKRDHVAAWFGFATPAGKRTVTMRIATSLISVAQARRNLAMEVGKASFSRLEKRARNAWDKQLAVIDIPGAADRSKTILYSNLYRLFLYPNQAFENIGSTQHAQMRYASPFSAAVGSSTPTHTGAAVKMGKPYVNNGFWDTYRTVWPLYALLTPKQDGRMIDGFVQQYRDGGWIARWSSPGYADLMVGTSADVAFADAWNKGIHNFDVKSFYQAALKDATVVSPIPGAGRKGLETSIFKGYTDTSTNEGMSWSMAGYLNDFGLAELAQALAKHPPPHDPYASHYADDARYFRNRADDFVHLFDKQVGFFVGRKPDGSWRTDAEHFDPFAWGGDYTETNAWNMAFSAVQDGLGLANLYGGRAGLAKKLDAFFNAPTIYHVGAYGGVIHEMREAHQVRMGQYGHSNQPSHAIIYMYDVAGQPWKTQSKVRDALSRLYIGSQIGQGYPGDADNGEMSAWWLFSAAGFYPLRMGTPTYAIGAPYFPRMIIHLKNGKRIVINAPKVSNRNRYIQSMTLDGKPYRKVYLTQADLENGATLDFRMGPKPSRWGMGEKADLPSLTTGSQPPNPLDDLVDTAHGKIHAIGITDSAALTDNTSDTDAILKSSSAGIDVEFESHPQSAEMYTLTSAGKNQPGAPAAWTLQGSNDGHVWHTLDTRSDQTFPWPQQTRAFGVTHPGRYSHYRLRFGSRRGAHVRALSQIELLGRPQAEKTPASQP